MMRLDSFVKQRDRGRPFWLELLWIFFQSLFRCSWLPGSQWRCYLLRFFGARVGRGVVIKSGVKIKFPWRLEIGDYSWIGEDVWIDNLTDVAIGAHCCLSQGVYLCTGNHDWSKSFFDLTAKPIVLKEGVWIAARAVVGPGVTVGEGVVLCLQSAATEDLAAWSIYQGNPASFVKKRNIS